VADLTFSIHMTRSWPVYPVNILGSGHYALNSLFNKY